MFRMSSIEVDAARHAAPAPPSSVMNSRRFTARSSRASDRKDSTPQLRQETVALRDFNPRYDHLGSNSTELTGGDTSIHVRSTPNTGRKFNASLPVALCH